jgi:gliding motility-associated-like protein
VPSAFTPNKDGINDYLFPFKYCDDYKDLKFSVFNRWGELLFQTNDINNGWDGFFKNDEQQLDDYIWILEYYDILHKQKIVKKGTASLLR